MSVRVHTSVWHYTMREDLKLIGIFRYMTDRQQCPFVGMHTPSIIFYQKVIHKRKLSNYVISPSIVPKVT